MITTTWINTRIRKPSISSLLFRHPWSLPPSSSYCCPPEPRCMPSRSQLSLPSLSARDNIMIANRPSLSPSAFSRLNISEVEVKYLFSAPLLSTASPSSPYLSLFPSPSAATKKIISQKIKRTDPLHHFGEISSRMNNEVSSQLLQAPREKTEGEGGGGGRRHRTRREGTLHGCDELRRSFKQYSYKIVWTFGVPPGKWWKVEN